MAAQSSSRATLVAMAASSLAAAAALTAGLNSRSSATMAAAVVALVSASSAALILYGSRRAEPASNARHPPASAMEAYFWSYVVALALFSMGAGVTLLEGVERLKQPQPVADAQLVMLGLGGAAALLALSAWNAVRTLAPRHGQGALVAALRTVKDPALFTVVLAQILAVLAFSIALAGVALVEVHGVRAADGVAALSIGLAVAAAAAVLALEVKRLITDPMASGTVRDGARQTAETVAGAGLPIGTAQVAQVALETKSTAAATASQPLQKPHVLPRDAGGKGRGKRRR